MILLCSGTQADNKTMNRVIMITSRSDRAKQLCPVILTAADRNWRWQPWCGNADIHLALFAVVVTERLLVTFFRVGSFATAKKVCAGDFDTKQLVDRALEPGKKPVIEWIRD